MALPSWHVYSDAGLAAFTNAAGSAIAALDAVLVNGYNTKTVTASVFSGVVTVTSTAHAFGAEFGKRVLIAGVTDQTSCNGVKDITVVNANSFTFLAPGVPDGALTGTITAKRAPLGWSKTYSSGNTAIYTPESALVGGDPFVVKIVDGTTTFSVELGVSHDGAGALTSGMAARYVGKFNSVGNWTIVGDGAIVYLVVEPSSPAESGGGDTVHAYYFGRTNPTQTFYPAPTVCAAKSTTGAATGNNDGDYSFRACSFADTAASENVRALYNYSQSSLDVPVFTHTLGANTGDYSGRINGTLYPSPTVGGFFTSPMFVSQVGAGTGPYAVLPGAQCVYCTATTNTTATRPARGVTDTLTGKTLILFHNGEGSYSAPVGFSLGASWR